MIAPFSYTRWRSERREVNILFQDTRGFTALSEKLDPVGRRIPSGVKDDSCDWRAVSSARHNQKEITISLESIQERVGRVRWKMTLAPQTAQGY